MNFLLFPTRKCSTNTIFALNGEVEEGARIFFRAKVLSVIDKFFLDVFICGFRGVGGGERRRK
jgi:hypothetical protein